MVAVHSREDLEFRTMSPNMERMYEIAPEMLGLSRWRLLRLAVARCVSYWIVALVVSYAFDRSWVFSIGAAIFGSLLDFFLTFLAPFFTSSKLRLTDSAIEEVDGPVIQRGTVVAVIDRSDSDPAGIEIVGRRKSCLLPKYRIFVPAALPEFRRFEKQS